MSLLRSDAGAGRDMQPMRHLAVLVAAITALAAAPPAHAAATGSISGRVVNGTTGEPQRGVRVTLTSGDGEQGSERSVTTGSDGRYRFDDLATGEDRFYVLDALYKKGLFAGRPLTLPADTRRPPVIETTLRVFEPTTDPNAILIRRNTLFVVHKGNQLSVVESVKVINPTNNAYIGRGSALAPTSGKGPTASLGFALPDAVLPETFQWQQADLDVPGAVELEGVGFAITTAIPPGEVDFTFTYQVAGEGGTFDISRRALYEVTEMSVFAAEPLTVESNRLQRGESEEIDGRTYVRFTTDEPADAADPIQILILAEAGSAFLLVAGAGTGLVVLLLVAALAFRRTRRNRPRETRAQVPEREQLVTEIAELDLRHSSGEIADDEYRRRRDALKARLAEIPAPGSAT